MNERIRELAEEHGFIHEYMTIGERNDTLTKYRKFAELIIRECIRLCDQVDLVGADECIDNIKEHFEVEE